MGHVRSCIEEWGLRKVVRSVSPIPKTYPKRARYCKVGWSSRALHGYLKDLNNVIRIHGHGKCTEKTLHLLSVACEKHAHH